VRVAVIDVGSNSVRLLIASVKRGSDVRELAREREYLRLGDDAYRLGRISERKLDELSGVAWRFTRRARTARVDHRVETIVTALGRQAANGDELLAVLGAATGAPVVQLTAEDEGRASPGTGGGRAGRAAGPHRCGRSRWGQARARWPSGRRKTARGGCVPATQVRSA